VVPLVVLVLVVVEVPEVLVGLVAEVLAAAEVLEVGKKAQNCYFFNLNLVRFWAFFLLFQAIF
jgi:hypothetical protein